MASIKKYATKQGTQWRVQYRSPDGKSRTKRGFDTKARAQAWADKNAVSIHDQDWIDPNAGKTTLTQLWNQWAPHQTHLAESSMKALTASWTTHIKPTFGDTPIRSLNAATLQQWVTDLAGRRSATTTHRAFGIIRSLTALALRDMLIRHDPTTGVQLPAKKPPKQTTITAQQVIELSKASKRYKSLILFLGFTGARWGEATALTVGDIDVKRGRATISKSVTGETKTRTTRTIAVPEIVLDAMKPDLKNKLPGALVWTQRDGNPVTTPSRRSWWHSAVDACMDTDPTFPEISPHDLRHAAASILISGGASVLIVQRQLGHASAKMTLDRYSHLFDADLDVVSDVVKMSSQAAK